MKRIIIWTTPKHKYGLVRIVPERRSNVIEVQLTILQKTLFNVHYLMISFVEFMPLKVVDLGCKNAHLYTVSVLPLLINLETNWGSLWKRVMGSRSRGQDPDGACWPPYIQWSNVRMAPSHGGPAQSRNKS